MSVFTGDHKRSIAIQVGVQYNTTDVRHTGRKTVLSGNWISCPESAIIIDIS